MAHGKRDLRLEARWRDLVGRQPASGLSVRAFCVRERVTEPAYYAWRRELRRRDGQWAKDAAADPPAFVPVVIATAGAGQITMELRGGRVLRLPATLALGDVAALVRAIEGDQQAGAA